MVTPNLEKKNIMLEDKAKGLVMKLKLLKEKEGEESNRLRLRFLKKRGELQDQYELME